MYQSIIDIAQQQGKNILILGSPRSGTHALGSHLSKIVPSKYLGEICLSQHSSTPWTEISLIYKHNILHIAQIVQFISKIYLAEQINLIKQHAVVVNIKRKNKIDQFASWMYFNTSNQNKWHNHTLSDSRDIKHSITVTEEDITQFKLEQLLDEYFLPDFKLCYEQLDFAKSIYYKNQFAYPLIEIFSNPEYVIEQLGTWEYSSSHFDQ